MTGRYAEGTTVSPERSQAEIAELLRRYGATGYTYGWDQDTDGVQRAAIAFKAHGRMVRFLVDLPDPESRVFWTTESGRSRDAAGARKAHESELRRRWRCLALAIKAKLEAVETGIATFEDEFLAYTVLPDGSTVSEQVQRQVEDAWKAGGHPPRLQIGGVS
ncbi:hypothetical protein [Cellulomonas sp. HZM]|uniref:hypothetical protein n=1 Tax=Cellulomonas sp. HZM TaxID=1454010 RepID=UPI000492FB67|nr:hypothetical protein [Cellulomonas sp. HZM]